MRVPLFYYSFKVFSCSPSLSTQSWNLSQMVSVILVCFSNKDTLLEILPFLNYLLEIPEYVDRDGEPVGTAWNYII